MNASFCFRLIRVLICIGLASFIFSGCQTSPKRNGDSTAQAFTPGSLEGDKRLKNLGLTEGEQQSTNDAAQAFATASKNKGGKGKLSKEEKIAREALAEILKKEGVPFIRIPAHSVKKYNFSAYCLDANLPEPKAGEKFRLVPAETVVPPQLNTAYQGLLRLAAQHGDTHSNTVQALLWKIRLSSSGTLGAQDRARLSLSPQEQQLLLQVDPNALGSVQSIMAVPLGEQAGQFALGLTRSLLKQVSPEFAGLADATVFQSLIDGDYQKIAQSIAQKAVNIPLPNDNSAFTSLSPSVSAHAVSESGGYHSLSIDLANNDDGDAFFLPSSCICQSTRPVQRLALQPPLQAFQTSQAEYQFSPTSEVAQASTKIQTYSYESQEAKYFLKVGAATTISGNPSYPDISDAEREAGRILFNRLLGRVTKTKSIAAVAYNATQTIADGIFTHFCLQMPQMSFSSCIDLMEREWTKGLADCTYDTASSIFARTSGNKNTTQASDRGKNSSSNNTDPDNNGRKPKVDKSESKIWQSLKRTSGTRLA